MDAATNTFDFGALARLKRDVTQPGVTQAGTTQAGTTQAGTTQAGTTQAGTTQAASGSGQTAQSTKNQAVAQQFEAIFLQMMLKRMREATPSDGLFDSDQTRLVQSLADEQLATQLAKPGIGLAQGLLRQIEGQGTQR